MTVRSFINRMLTPAQEAAPEPVTTDVPVPIDPPGSTVHHEIMLGEQRMSDLRFPWLCRVYAQNGAATEKVGDADTPQAAMNAALSWAAITKAGLRGDV